MSSSDEVCIVFASDGELEDNNVLDNAPRSDTSEKGRPNPVAPTEEEIEYREKNFSGLVVQKLKLLCTSCGKSLELIRPQLHHIASHPILDVLLCKTCADFYGEGDFSVDEDGTDKYCRWCGQGGTLYLCSDCNYGFCRPCIKRNLHRSVLNDVHADDWKCFSCDSKPLWELRGICAATLEYIKERKEKKKEVTKSSKKTMISTSESEYETVPQLEVGNCKVIFSFYLSQAISAH